MTNAKEIKHIKFIYSIHYIFALSVTTATTLVASIFQSHRISLTAVAMLLAVWSDSNSLVDKQ